MILIRVHGKPAPQGSKTKTRYGGFRESSTALGPWRDAVRTETQRAILEQDDEPYRAGEPVEVSILFLFNRPKDHYRTGRYAHLLRGDAPQRPAGGPDGDKLARAIFDAITQGGALADDKQVADFRVSKDYVRPGEVPGCMIRIELAGIVPAVERRLFDPVIRAMPAELGG